MEKVNNATLLVGMGRIGSMIVWCLSMVGVECDGYEA